MVMLVSKANPEKEVAKAGMVYENQTAITNSEW